MSRLCITACSLTLMMGCVFRDFEYDPPPDLPPSVESSTTGPTPLNRVVDVLLTAPVGEDGGAFETQFEAEVRDANVGQLLQGRIWLDRNPNLPEAGRLLREIDVLAVAEPDPRRRIITFSVPNTLLTPGCHLVELLVSGQFQNVPSNEPRVEGDLGTGAWWLAVRASEGDTVDMTTCPPE